MKARLAIFVAILFEGCFASGAVPSPSPGEICDAQYPRQHASMPGTTNPEWLACVDAEQAESYARARAYSNAVGVMTAPRPVANGGLPLEAKGPQRREEQEPRFRKAPDCLCYPSGNLVFTNCY